MSDNSSDQPAQSPTQQARFNETRELLLELQDDPDEVTIERALNALALLRDGLEQSQAVLRLGQDLRDELVARVAQAAPHLQMRKIAQSAGYTDSYAARVAQQRGVKPRARRRSRNKDPGADGEPAPGAFRATGAPQFG